MLPGTGRRSNNSGCGDGDGRVAEGGGADCHGRPQRRYGEGGRTGAGRGDCSGGGYGKPIRSFGELPPANVGVVQVLEDVGGGEAGESISVPYGLHPGIRPAYLPEHDRPGLEAQLLPYHGLRVPVWSLAKVTLLLPWSQDAPPAMSTCPSDEDAGR